MSTLPHQSNFMTTIFKDRFEASTGRDSSFLNLDNIRTSSQSTQSQRYLQYDCFLCYSPTPSSTTLECNDSSSIQTVIEQIPPLKTEQPSVNRGSTISQEAKPGVDRDRVTQIMRMDIDGRSMRQIPVCNICRYLQMHPEHSNEQIAKRLIHEYNCQ